MSEEQKKPEEKTAQAPEPVKAESERAQDPIAEKKPEPKQQQKPPKAQPKITDPVVFKDQKQSIDVLEKGDVLTVQGYEIFSYVVHEIDRLDEVVMKFRQREGIFEDDVVVVLRKKH